MPRGDVLSVHLPSPPGGTGREQAGRRPAIAVQADDADPGLPTTIVVPLTGKLAALRFPHTIGVEPSSQNGLSQTSVVLVFQLRAIDRDRILATLGRLEQHYLDQLDDALRRLLGVAG